MKGLNMRNEEWRDVVGYEGYYQVSNLGRVRSLDMNVRHWRGGLSFKKGRILKQTTNNTGGYKRVRLTKHGRYKDYSVHRLVADAFIPNPNNYRCVNHKDEVKTNNNVENLEWCTYKYNSNYGTLPKRISEKHINRPEYSKPVLQFTKQGEFIKEYPSAHEVQRQIGIHNYSISACCRGIYKTAGGFIWKYKSINN